MRRLLIGSVAAISMTIAMSAGVSGHEREIETPSGKTHQGWVGAADIPGQGKGLVPGGPTGDLTLTPAHEKGLVSACEAIRANGNGVIDIYGPAAPGTPTTCRHGGR